MVWRFTSILAHAADLGQHTGIILEDVPNREYTLTLLVDNEGRELQRKDNQTWTPTQRLCVSSLLTTDIY